jgi:hypothetical protein
VAFVAVRAVERAIKVVLQLLYYVFRVLRGGGMTGLVMFWPHAAINRCGYHRRAMCICWFQALRDEVEATASPHNPDAVN